MKKLRRPQEGRKLMGVCAGLARFLGIDAVFVRVLWVLICLFPPISSFMAIAAYILLGYIIPEETDYIDVYCIVKGIKYEKSGSFIGAWQYS